MSSSPDQITVVGARVHNLKGVDLALPRDSLVVFTGLSGSGKSSLAFDTIYQEGQRRFMESLSAYARQFLGKMEKPNVDHVEGLSPTISIDQKTVNRNPRSTVGTVTEILDHLRLLMARLGTAHCPHCDKPIQALGPGQIASDILDVPVGTRVILMAPVVRERKGEYRKELAQLAEDGWLRARIDGELLRLDEPIELARYEKHTIEVVMDRVKISPEARPRVVEAVERALKMSKGVITALVSLKTGEVHRTWSSDRSCPDHPQVAIPELEPRLFSFNAPQGACGTCNGLGELVDFDTELMIDPNQKLPKAILPLGDQGRLPFAGSVDNELISALAKHLGGDLRKKWKDQSVEVQRGLLLGENVDYQYTTVRKVGTRTDKRVREYTGLLPTIRHIWHFTHHRPFERFRRRTVCHDCGGARLNEIARSIRFRNANIGELSSMTVGSAVEFFSGVKLRGKERTIGHELVREIQDRLGFLDGVGLAYLSLNRSSATLSGGEAQRIRLAAQVGSGLRGVTYVLDEPSIGLHPRDNQRLLKTLLKLRDQGNSVLVVEHDKETMEKADYVVDVGPGAGINGGEIVAQGPPRTLKGKDSSTVRFLHGEESLPLPEQRRSGSGEHLNLVGASANNLDSITADFPLGTLTAITGVSGSGKSSLVVQTLQRALKAHFATGKVQSAAAQRKPPGPHQRIDGLEHVDKVIVIDQQPIGRTPRSNPGTYTGAFDHIRKLFAMLPESKARGYKPGRFSFNVKGGRCEECQGAGLKTIEMQFLADVQVPCEACETHRFNAETLEIRYRGKTITGVLDMSIGDAAEFFKNHRALKRILNTLVSVGMGYVKVGQPSTTLSGGEAQRIKLASELQRPSTGRTLYILDEPTTGLHFKDIERLVHAIDRLVDAGNTVLVIEHNTDIIKRADHVIDLGPEGGSGGGEIVGVGTPEQIALLDTPTGRVLANLPEFGGPPATFAPRRVRKSRRDEDLVITGATCHNLKDIDVRIPKASLTVITGVSGSGKTSLAFDTIFAEGQRRYVECMSTYARRFLGRLDRAPVERVTGLAPAIAINQKSASHNPRSTVATVTELYDYLRLLWARIGVPHCHHCGVEIRGASPSAAARRLSAEASERGWILAELPPAAPAAGFRLELQRSGFLRLLGPSGEVALEDAACEPLIEAGATLVIDRVNPSRTPRSRLSEAFQTAYDYGSGRATFRSQGGAQWVYTAAPTCPDHGAALPADLTPRHFSFNSYLGACTRCDGLGRVSGVDTDRLLIKPHRPLWAALDQRVASVLKRSKRQNARLKALFKVLELPWTSAVQDWSPEQRQVILHGTPELRLSVKWTRRWGKSSKQIVTEEVDWTGIIPLIEGWSGELAWLRSDVPCPACKGGRLKPEILAVTLAGKDIGEACGLTVDAARAFFETVELSDHDTAVAEQPLHEVLGRLRFLDNVGLSYLNLERSARTLSGGESQRIRLASQLGSGLTGCIYVLDEPTVGLHPRDTKRLLGTLAGLRSLGNTVVVVEHDTDTMRAADHILDLGPGAGDAGGHLVASGSPDQLMADPDSLTGAYLSGRRQIPRRATPRRATGSILVTGARVNNLRHVNARFPTGCLTVVTGVSGSGKSSLVMDCLVPGVAQAFKQGELGNAADKVDVPKGHKKLVVVNQQAIGTTPRSTPATYVKLMDGLRDLYANTNAAKVRGFTKGRFSFNAKAGRCPQCEGRGSILIEMHFLSDVWVVCDLCKGRRYDDSTLEVRWRGLSIGDVLDLRVSEALEHFQNHRRLARPLQALQDVGLGYIRLGQPGTTLSGGEAQRVKLAKELGGRPQGTVFVLDEPTTGLHFADVEKLLEVLHRLVDAGATVVCIEHNVDVIANADHIIDMGPEGGLAGGQIIAMGTPTEMAQADTPTGRVLADLLSRPAPAARQAIATEAPITP